MDIPWTIAAVVLGIWLLCLMLQLGDLGTSQLNARSTRPFWLAPFGAVVAVVLVLGVDYGGRLLLTQVVPGLLLLGAVATCAVGAWLVVVFATKRRAAPGYADLQRDLVQRFGERLSREQIVAIRSRLRAIDENAELTHRGELWWRVLPAVIGAMLLAATWIAVGSARDLWWLVALASAAPIASAVLAVVGARAHRAVSRARAIEHTKQRAECEQLLSDLERRSTKRVAGLGERVTRALQILREQQG